MRIEQEHLRGVDLEIDEELPMQVRDLEPGQMYIRLGHFISQREDWHNVIRRRTEDPYRSETVLGSRVIAFPSERVFPVNIFKGGVPFDPVERFR